MFTLSAPSRSSCLITGFSLLNSEHLLKLNSGQLRWWWWWWCWSLIQTLPCSSSCPLQSQPWDAWLKILLLVKFKESFWQHSRNMKTWKHENIEKRWLVTTITWWQGQSRRQHQSPEWLLGCIWTFYSCGSIYAYMHCIYILTSLAAFMRKHCRLPIGRIDSIQE